MMNIETLNITSRLLAQEAKRRGYTLDGYNSAPSAKSTTISCTKDGFTFYFKSLCTALTPSYGVFAAQDKILTYNILKAKNISTPETMALKNEGSMENSKKFLAKWKKVVVKPSNTNHGDGVSINVNSQDELSRAITHARSFGSKETDVIIQQQVYGDEYRFLVLNGKVIAVATRRPPSVVGDGASTVYDLIAQKNSDPRRGIGHAAELTKIDFDDVRNHNPSGFLESIPKKGAVCFVLHTSNLSKGGDSIDVTDTASEELKQLAIMAAQSCFLGVAGVDIMTNDIGSKDTSDSYVIEVNASPGIRMHQFPAEGTPRDVACMLFDAIENQAHKKRNEYHIKKIGVTSAVDFVGYKNLKQIPARIDTGARTSSLWASDIKIKDGVATFKLFGPSSPWYTGKVVRRAVIEQREVTSSTGDVQNRPLVKLSIKLHGKRLAARFTLSDRSTQTYPILIGRNTLRWNFLVDSSDPGEAVMYKDPDEATEFNEVESEA